MIVLIADAAQNGLGKEYQSVTEGLVLVITIVAWEYLIDWLTSGPRPYLRPPSLTLIKDGRIVEEATRKEMLSMDELQFGTAVGRPVTNYDDLKISIDLTRCRRDRPHDGVSFVVQGYYDGDERRHVTKPALSLHLHLTTMEHFSRDFIPVHTCVGSL